MSLHNFHPNKAVLLDGYGLLRYMDPNLNIHNGEIASYVMKQVLEQVKFKPIFGSKQTNPGKWLGIDDKAYSWYWSKISNSLSGQSFALNALLPNGRVIKQLYKFDITSYFMDEDNVPYVTCGDGMIICLIPVLDERFLKFYQKHDYELTPQVKEALTQEYGIPIPNGDSTYDYGAF